MSNQICDFSVSWLLTSYAYADQVCSCWLIKYTHAEKNLNALFNMPIYKTIYLNALFNIPIENIVIYYYY